MVAVIEIAAAPRRTKRPGRHPDKALSAAFVRSAPPGRHADGNGLYLFVQPTGTRSWIQRVAEAFSCRTKTVENIRQRCVLKGFEQALERKRRESPPVEKLLDGEQESQVIALRLGPPPKGYANWSLRLLARRVVELGVVESISHETIRRTLKKTA